MKQRPPRVRSAVTNGNRVFLTPVDGNSEVARRFKDIMHEVERERGGPDALSVTVREACRAYAGLAVVLEGMHADLASGRPVDVEAMGIIGDRLDRQARRMGPVKAAERASLRDHFAGRRGKA